MLMTTMVKLTARIRLWHMRRRTTAELAALDDRILKDIGLHRSEIRQLVDGLLAAEETRAAGGGTIAAASRPTPDRAGWIESCNA